MTKEKQLGHNSKVFRGEDLHPKRAEEEEEVVLEMEADRQEVVAKKVPGKAGAGTLQRPVPGKRSWEPPRSDSGASGEERLPVGRPAGHGPSAPAFGMCRSQLAEMPHWCLECGKNFGHKAELEKHQLNHAGPCSYICSDCGRSFTEHVALPACQGVRAAGTASSHSGCRRGSFPLSTETAAVPRKERKELSLQEKVRVLQMLEGPKVSQSELAKRFGVSQPQICRIIKNRERILAEWRKNANAGRKRKLEEKGAAGEAALLQWFEGSCAPSNGVGMCQQDEAKSLSKALGKPEWEAGLGWLAKQKAPLERPPAEKQKGEAPEDGHWESAALPLLLSQYEPPSIYACGEAGILFRATPEGLALGSREGAKDQLTVLLCTNLDASDKRDALIVGKEETPLCFRGVGVEDLPATYRADRKAWMTAAIFTEWLQKFNEDMKRRQRTVALVLARCGAHPCTELSNVRMVFVPPRPARVHPLEQGVIQNFRCHYRRRMLTRLLVALDSKASGQLTLLDAVHMIVQAWSEVCPQTITEGFQAAGFGRGPRVLAPPADVVQALGFTDQKQFERFVMVDDGLECFGDQEGAELVKEGRRCQEPVCEAAEGEEGAGVLPLLSCPSKAEVMESLAKLRRYLECHSASPAIFQMFYKLEDVLHGISLAHLQGSLLARAKAWSKE